MTSPAAIRFTTSSGSLAILGLLTAALSVASIWLAESWPAAGECYLGLRNAVMGCACNFCLELVYRQEGVRSCITNQSPRKSCQSASEERSKWFYGCGMALYLGAQHAFCSCARLPSAFEGLKHCVETSTYRGKHFRQAELGAGESSSRHFWSPRVMASEHSDETFQQHDVHAFGFFQAFRRLCNATSVYLVQKVLDVYMKKCILLLCPHIHAPEKLQEESVRRSHPTDVLLATLRSWKS